MASHGLFMTVKHIFIHKTEVWRCFFNVFSSWLIRHRCIVLCTVNVCVCVFFKTCLWTQNMKQHLLDCSFPWHGDDSLVSKVKYVLLCTQPSNTSHPCLAVISFSSQHILTLKLPFVISHKPSLTNNRPFSVLGWCSKPWTSNISTVFAFFLC